MDIRYEEQGMGDGGHRTSLSYDRGIVDLRFMTRRKSRGSVGVSKSREGGRGLGIAHGVFYDAGIAIGHLLRVRVCFFSFVLLFPSQKAITSVFGDLSFPEKKNTTMSFFPHYRRVSTIIKVKFALLLLCL